jgi:hypothetical protein
LFYFISLQLHRNLKEMERRRTPIGLLCFISLEATAQKPERNGKKEQSAMMRSLT